MENIEKIALNECVVIQNKESAKNNVSEKSKESQPIYCGLELVEDKYFRDGTSIKYWM